MSAEAMARQTETQKIIREVDQGLKSKDYWSIQLREQIRLLEIDKRNLSDTKESGMVQREMLEVRLSLSLDSLEKVILAKSILYVTIKHFYCTAIFIKMARS